MGKNEMKYLRVVFGFWAILGITGTTLAVENSTSADNSLTVSPASTSVRPVKKKKRRRKTNKAKLGSTVVVPETIPSVGGRPLAE